MFNLKNFVHSVKNSTFVCVTFVVALFLSFSWNSKDITCAQVSESVCRERKFSDLNLNANFNDAVLNTQRLLIRPVTENDYSSLISLVQSLSDDELRFFTPYNYSDFDKLRRDEGALSLIVNHKDIASKKFGNYALCLKNSGNLKIIGNISITYFVDGFDEFENSSDPKFKEITDRSACIGIFIDPQYQKQGYGTEALEAVVEMLLNKPCVDCVVVDCCMRNIASRKMIEKAADRILAKIKNGKESGALNDELSRVDKLTVENLERRDVIENMFVCAFKKAKLIN